MTVGSSQRSLRRNDTLRRVAACAAALLIFSAGCQSADAPLDTATAEPGETPAATATDTKAGEEAARLVAGQAALAQARRALQDGDPLSALAIASRALIGGAPDEVASALRRVRLDAREALVKERVLRLQVLPDRDAVAAGSEVGLTIRLRNVSAAPVVVPATADGSSNSLLVLDVVRTDYDVYGNLRETEFNLRIPLEEDVQLPPGGEAAIHAQIPASLAGLTHVGFAVLQVGGHLRPVSIRIGATEFFDALPLEEARVRVFMQGYEQLADEPLESLRRSVQKRSPPHILTAAELLAPAERKDAIALLEAAAEDDPPLAFVLEAAATRLRDLERDTRN